MPAAVGALNRVAFDRLAVVAPGFLRARPEWVER
jgi:hypothetical protein